MENVNLQNGNVSVTVPLLHLPGVAGHDFDLRLLINSKVMTMNGGMPPHWDSANQRYEYTPPSFNAPQTPQIAFAGGYLNIPFLTSKLAILETTTYDSSGTATTLRASCGTGYTFYDLGGSAHGFSNFSPCSGDAHPNDPEVDYTESSDGAFFRLDTTNSSDTVVYDRSGIQYHFGSGGGLVQRIVDPSGNSISFAVSGPYSNRTYTVTDSVGHVITITSSSITYYDSNGTSRTISVGYTDLGVQGTTQFTQSGGKAQDGGGGDYVWTGTRTGNNYVSKYTLSYPTGEQYGFTYSGFSEISRIDYPSGGYTAYTYQSVPGAYIDSNWRVYADIREIQSKSVCPKTSGSCQQSELLTTTYTANTSSNTDQFSGDAAMMGDANASMEVIDPSGNLTHVDFYRNTWGPTVAAVEKQRLVYAGNGNTKQLLRTTAYGYPSTIPDLCGPNPTSVTTTLNDVAPSLSSRVEYDYLTLSLSDDPHTDHGVYNQCPTAVQTSNVIAKREYGYDGSLIRTTTNGWLASSTAAPHMLDLQSSSTVSTSGFQSTHSRNYTANGLLHDETFGGTNATNSTTIYGHDSNGRLISVQDARNNSTTYGYDGSWANTGNCGPFISPRPTTVTDSLGHASHAILDACTGTVHSSADVNGNTTSFGYDARLRIASQSNPDGGGMQVAYSPGSGTSVTTTQSAGVLTAVVLHDGLGRTASKQVTSDPNGTMSIDFAYDPVGNVQSVSNPHYGTATLYTAYKYDALGRVKDRCDADNGTGAICNPSVGSSDLNYAKMDYSGTQTTFTDEAGHAWTDTYDALGRLIGVSEPTGASTTYGYNILNALTSVTQSGVSGETARSRSFSYDGVNHLITSTNPETGTICYGAWNGSSCQNGYDPTGNLVAKTDARGKTVHYQYDALNRLTRRWSDDGTVDTRTYWDTWNNTYGVSNACTNGIGRPCGQDHYGIAGTLFNYDSMGRVTSTMDATYATAYHPSFQARYDAAGNATDLTYPDGRTITQGFDGAGRLTSVRSGTSSAPGASYYSVASFFANGSVQTHQFAAAALTQTYVENSRQQDCAVAAANSSYLIQHSFYTYAPNPGSDPCAPVAGNNGNLWHISDQLPSGVSTQNFQYDTLNRLTWWEAPAMAGGYRTRNFDYDSFGNIGQRSSPTPPYNMSTLFDASNRYTTAALNCAAYASQSANYDAAGNVLCDGGYMTAKQYSYDAEGQVTQMKAEQACSPVQCAGGANYFYNGMGERARVDQFNPSGNLTSYREYMYLNGFMLAERDGAGAWTDYVYANGKKVAAINSGKPRIHTHGNFTGGNEALWSIPTPVNVNGTAYVVKGGDQLCWRQYQTGGQSSGVLFFWNNQWMSVRDTNNTYTQSLTDQNQWTNRCIDLTAGGAKTGTSLSDIELYTGYRASGGWDIWYEDMAVHSTDGTVTPVLNGNLPTPSFTLTDNGNYTGPLTAIVDTSTTSGLPDSPHYFLGDQVGTVQFELSAGAWPVWKGEFSPFGMELDTPALASDRYKFTGKERDTESGLDYFGARYMSSTMGRFISPDWSAKAEPVPYSKLDDPQTLNLYAYVGNNPVSRSDPDGHDMLSNLRMLLMEGVPTRDDLNEAEQLTKQAQQQYGRQSDGSYKADPAKVQAAIDAGKPIHEPGNPDQKSECVFACKFLAQMRNIGTSQWRKGRAAAGLNDTTDIGLAIATLGSGTYPSQHGNSGIYMGHDSNGGIIIVDQWPNNGPEYNHPFAHTLTRHDQGPAMDPNAYFVIMVPKP